MHKFSGKKRQLSYVGSKPVEEYKIYPIHYIAIIKNTNTVTASIIEVICRTILNSSLNPFKGQKTLKKLDTCLSEATHNLPSLKKDVKNKIQAYDLIQYAVTFSSCKMARTWYQVTMIAMITSISRKNTSLLIDTQKK